MQCDWHQHVRNHCLAGGPSRGNSGAPSNVGENGTMVFSLRGPTEVILAQMKMNVARTGSNDSLSGASWRSPSSTSSPHRHTQSGTPKTGMLSHTHMLLLIIFGVQTKSSVRQHDVCKLHVIKQLQLSVCM